MLLHQCIYGIMTCNSLNWMPPPPPPPQAPRGGGGGLSTPIAIQKCVNGMQLIAFMQSCTFTPFLMIQLIMHVAIRKYTIYTSRARNFTTASCSLTFLSGYPKFCLKPLTSISYFCLSQSNVSECSYSSNANLTVREAMYILPL